MLYSLKDLPGEFFQQAGETASSLARLAQSGYPVPEGFVLLPDAFEENALKDEAWQAVQIQLASLRQKRAGLFSKTAPAFAVRSSAVDVDTISAAYIGTSKTALNAVTDDEVLGAILKTRAKTHHAPSQAEQTRVEIAVIVQRLWPTNYSGVLFTADPHTGSRADMNGYYIHSASEGPVTVKTKPVLFSLDRPHGNYNGPDELALPARKLYRLATRLEAEAGCPQEIEWTAPGSKLYLLQARPVKTLVAHHPENGKWNDSHSGDYLWTNAILGDALPEVMTPATWSLARVLYSEGSPVASPVNFPLVGNLDGRAYTNISLLVTLFCADGMKYPEAMRRVHQMLGNLPKDLEIPLVSIFNPAELLARPLDNIRRELRLRRKARGLADFVRQAPARCTALMEQIAAVSEKTALAELFMTRMSPYLLEACSMLRVSTGEFDDPAARLRADLVRLAGEEDASVLLSGLSSESDRYLTGLLTSLGRLSRGEIDREDYLRQYGHRGPGELELSAPRPAEDSTWIDQQLAGLRAGPVQVEELLARQRQASLVARERFKRKHPTQARAMGARLSWFATATRRREAIRSEIVRVAWVIRCFVQHAGELTGLGEGAFFLSLEELQAVLQGAQKACAYIPARQKTYAAYTALPSYPVLINGRFDPFRWAADPARRNDGFDSHSHSSLLVTTKPDTITGIPGAAGQVEGRVRLLEHVEDSHLLQPGEILVITAPHLGWTPVFPRLAALITDVGAPLSQAAILANELGIPAVVGCGDATRRLMTGNRVRVDGGRGVVHILPPAQTRLQLY